MSWNQVFIPLCYRYFLLNQKKNVGVKYVYQKYQVRNEKKEMALKWRFQFSFSLVTVFKNSHKQTQKIFKQNTLSCA